MNTAFKIGDRWVGVDYPPFIIAEMSGNHNQSLDRALAIVDAAAAAGAHALKIQTYTPDTMTLDVDNDDFRVREESSLWSGRMLHELYREAHTPWDWHQAIFSRAHALGLLVFSTPFDESSVEFLEQLNPPCYKIASFENTDLPLIRRVAATGKPLIVSTGLASVAELDDTVRAARGAGCRNLVLLKCTSSYPASPEHSHLRTIPHLRELFACEVGLSDHTPGIGVAAAAIALGATVIEKHFTLDRSAGGIDSAFSLEPRELGQLVTEADRAWQGLGKISYGAVDSEKESLRFRRSLYVVRDLMAGEILTTESVRAIRPGFGLPTKYLDQILGRRVTCPVKRGTPVTWKLV